jgi:streptomycin 6-kinase
MIEVSAAVRNKARAAGAQDWLDQLPELLSSLEADWTIVVGRSYGGGSEAFVAEAVRADGTSAVLKVLVPGVGNDPSNEATMLRLVGGDGCPVLYQYDANRGAARVMGDVPA